MAMSSYITLLNDVRVDTDAPKTYLTLKYAYERDGANMKYKIYAYARLSSSQAYRNDSCGLQIKLDDVEVYNNSTWKPSGASQWPVSFEQTFTVSNKTSGNTSLYVRFWDSQGSVGDLNYSHTWNDLIVAPAGPILLQGSISQYINHLRVNVSNSITGNMTKYELARVSDGVVVKSGNLSSVTSFVVDITGLTPNTSYNGTYKIRAYANDCWGDWLTLSSSNLKTSSLPTASISSTSVTLGNNQTLTLSSLNDITSYSYALKTTVDSATIKNESSLTSIPKTISLNSTQINNILSKYPNTSTCGCKIITTIISNGTTYTLNELAFNYVVPNTYKPTFDSSNVTNLIDILNSSITGDNTKFIENHNRLQGTISPMVANGYATGNNYVITNGSKSTSLNYSSNNQTFTLDNVISNSVSVVASDSRGFTTNVNKTINIIPYSSPVCNNINIVRQNGVGTFAVLSANGTYTNWNGLTVTNRIKTIKYKWKLSTDTNYSNLIDAGTIVNNNGTWSINATLPTSFSASNKYDIVLVFEDELETITLNPYRLSTAVVFIWRDLLHKWLGINKKPDCALDVNGDTKVSGDLYSNTLDLFNDTSGSSWETMMKNKIDYCVANMNTNKTNAQMFINGGWAGVNYGFGMFSKIGTYYQLIWHSTFGSYFCTYNASNNTYSYKKFETDILNQVYPVGSIYISANNTNPGTIFGGTWTQLKNHFLFATNATSGNKGKDAVSSHTGTNVSGTAITTNQMPSHTHAQDAHAHSGFYWTGGQAIALSTMNGDTSNSYTLSYASGKKVKPSNMYVGSTTATNQNTGGGQTHNHGVSYIEVYVWQRTA